MYYALKNIFIIMDNNSAIIDRKNRNIWDSHLL